jgi:hypothetical protein
MHRVRNVVSDHYSVCNSALCNHDQASYRHCLFQENKAYGSKNPFAVKGTDVQPRMGDPFCDFANGIILYSTVYYQASLYTKISAIDHLKLLESYSE